MGVFSQICAVAWRCAAVINADEAKAAVLLLGCVSIDPGAT